MKMTKGLLGALILTMMAMPMAQAYAQAQPPVISPPSSAPAAPVMASPTSPAADDTAGAPLTSTVTYSYHLGSGDKIRVIVFGEDALGGEFTITGEGKVSLPLIGDVVVGGKTAPELQAALENAYRQGYLKDPKVNVEVLNFRPFYILGEVKMPGEYPYDNGMTVVKAVALAQGFTYRADQKKVYIRHINNGKEEQISLSSSQPVEPGDTIRIAERYF